MIYISVAVEADEGVKFNQQNINEQAKNCAINYN